MSERRMDQAELINSSRSSRAASKWFARATHVFAGIEKELGIGLDRLGLEQINPLMYVVGASVIIVRGISRSSSITAVGTTTSYREKYFESESGSFPSTIPRLPSAGRL